MSHLPPHDPSPHGLPLRGEDAASHGASEPAWTPDEQRLLAQLDAVLGPAQPPEGLVDAVVDATGKHLPDAVVNQAESQWVANLDQALAPPAAPAGLADAVLAATAEHVAAAGSDTVAQLDRALVGTDAPAGLIDAVLEATRKYLPVSAPVGRIGFDRGTWRRGIAAAALVAIAGGAWWMGVAGDQPAVNRPVASRDALSTPAQTMGGDSLASGLELAPDAAELLEPFDTIDRRLAQAPSSGDGAADPAALPGERLAAVADADLWSGSGLDGIDRAIDWEVAFEAADDSAWLF